MLTNNYIRLTSDHQSRQGAIWNSVPCRVRNWELHVQFNVHGSGKNLYGDGFAIWYTKHRLQLGPVFGSMDYFVGLAIFLDTYSNHNGPHNHQHPYVSAMINNGSLHYDHDRDGTHTALEGCEAHFRNKDHDTFIAIRYHGTTLKVSLDIDGQNNWKECFIAHGVYLPTGYYFGASAATGDLADNHDIISMKLYEIDSSVDTAPEYYGLPKAENVEPPRDHVDDHRNTVSGWKIFFIIILVLIGIAVCGVVGYVIFMKSQENSRKRLY
ncbi:hypothetical protein CHS0354_016652 [Potamilus streckersoni]|uniref:L-type lectin-like domain-containing protein n=1 Tax=Potamilus streckersoni TaxID=2493646 RepID=A0AAE0TIX8_9BIVA|nr:hypothetical protein CHS0354_016652 [Potamilus streckersoni]